MLFRSDPVNKLTERGWEGTLGRLSQKNNNPIWNPDTEPANSGACSTFHEVIQPAHLSLGEEQVHQLSDEHQRQHTHTHTLARTHTHTKSHYPESMLLITPYGLHQMLTQNSQKSTTQADWLGIFLGCDWLDLAGVCVSVCV